MYESVALVLHCILLSVCISGQSLYVAVQEPGGEWNAAGPQSRIIELQKGELHLYTYGREREDMKQQQG